MKGHCNKHIGSERNDDEIKFFPSQVQKIERNLTIVGALQLNTALFSKEQDK
jgi:hypothetical protein